MNIFPGFFGAIAASLKKLLNWNNESVLFGSLSTGSNDNFGYSVAMNSLGDRIIVGAFQDERASQLSSQDEGLAYIFVSGASGWSQQQILSGTLAISSSDNFGISVAINSTGDRAIIGAYQDERADQTGAHNEGLAYIFVSGTGGWSQQQILSGSIATNLGDNFGRSVAINSMGDRVIVGSYFDESSTTTQTVFPANAYVFRLRDTYGDGWNGGVMQVRQGTTVVSALTMSSGAGPVDVPVTLTPGLSYNLFFSTAGSFPSELRVEIVDPNSAIIYNQTTSATVNTTLHTWTAISGPGAILTTTSSLPGGSGLAYIFVSGTGGWIQQQILSGSLATEANDNFGWSVAINSTGDRVIVGALQDERPAGSAGEGLAYIFVSGAGGWSQQQILSGTLANVISDFFGYSVAMNSTGDRVAVGAWQDERVTGASAEGLVYIFVSGTGGWSQQQILSGTLATGSNDNFGYSVAMNSTGDCVAVGAWQDERVGQTGTHDEGLVYIFVSGTGGWSQQQILSGTLATGSSDNFGCSVAMNSTGDRILVGVGNDERITGASSEGLAYVYNSNISEIINNFSYSLNTSSFDFGNIAIAFRNVPVTSSNFSLNVSSGYLYTPMLANALLSVSSSVSNNYSISPSSIFMTPAAGGTNSNINILFTPSVGSSSIAGLITVSSSIGTSFVSLTGSVDKIIDNWNSDSILFGSLATSSLDRFGESVSMNSAGDRIIVGARQDERVTGSNDVGLAYIFVSGASGWSEQQILSGTLAISSNDLFGNSVAMNSAGDRVVVGAPSDDSNTILFTYPGDTYLFRMRDQFSDGWAGSTMQILQNSSVIATLTGPIGIAGPVDQYVALTPGLQYDILINFQNTSPSAIASEMRVEIIDSNGTTIFNQTSPSSVGQIIHTWTAVSGTGINATPEENSGLAYIFVSGANGWTQQQILSGSLATGSGDNFGYSVAMNSAGDRIIVGAYQDELTTGNNTIGLAYIFVSGANGWTEQQILNGTLATSTGDFFGNSVAMNSAGDRVVVGASWDNNYGLAYTFVSGAGGWSQQQILSGTLATVSGDLFGHSVAMNANGDRIIVGAYQDELATGNSTIGLAYIFVSGASGWSQQQILNGTLAIDSSDFFGWSVAMNASGNIVVVGAVQDERPSGATSTGLAYIFISGSQGWVQYQILSGTYSTNLGDNFGNAVAIDSIGDRAIVGANFNERRNGALSEGLAYVYDYNIPVMVNSFTYFPSTSSINFGNLGTGSILTSSSSISLNVPAEYLYSPMNDTVTVTVSSSISGTYTINPSTAILTPAFGGMTSSFSVNYIPNTSGEITGLITFSASVGTASVSLTGSSTLQRFMQTQILSGSLATGSSDAFGYSVAMNASGNIAVVGAWQDERPAGSAGEGLVYVFISGANGWTEQQILSGSLATGSGDIFGESVAINTNGDRIIVGASQDERSSQISTHNEGLAYVFISGTNGWTEQTILSGTLATGSTDRFGRSVAINTNGDRVIVGAFGDEKITSGEGLAYVFISSSNGWSQEQILSGSLATGSSDNFGWSVAMNSVGDRVVVGAILDERSSQISTHNEGLAYVFVSGAGGWTEQAILSGSFATGSTDGFGTSVTINASGNIVVVGAPTDETGSITSTGVAYIYTSGTSGWQQQQILSGPIGRSGDQFGYSVSINPTGNRIIVGGHQSYTSSVGGNFVGIAVTYVSGANGWEQYQILTGSLAIQSLDQFGVSVANDASGERVLIGANFDERPAGSSSEGLAYIMDLKIV